MKKETRKKNQLTISICGFKSLADRQTVEIRPLTVLAGANSSGKSSIMQPLLLMKQTLEAQYDPGVFLMDGPNVRFTSADQVLSKIPGRECVDEFSVGFDYDEFEFDINDRLEIKYKKSKFGFKIQEIAFGRGKQFIINQDMKPEDIVRLFSGDSLNENMENPAKYEWPSGAKVIQERCFLFLEDVNDPFSLVYPGGLIHGLLQDIIHLPGLRGNPERSYSRAAFGEHFPGLFPNYVASILHYWKTNNKDKLKQLGEYLQKLGLTWKVEPKELNAAQFEIQVGRLSKNSGDSSKDLVNITDVGVGVSQCLPVIVALMVAKEGQIVYIEQPEIHLHPRAQVALAEVIADAAKRGVLAVIETHSQSLLLGIQTLVAKGLLDRELVKFHWFHRKDDGSTEISSVDLDKNGAYGDWPEDFSEVELKLENDFLDAAEESDEMGDS